MTEHEDDFLEIRNRLFTELVLLTDLWEQYRVLFMSSARQVKRLNEHARWFFATVQRVFLHQIIIGISRITDPAASGRQRNVTLAALLQDPRLRELEAQHAALAAEVETVRAAASPRSTGIGRISTPG